MTKLDYSDFPVLNSKILYIKGEKYNYKIISIEENIVTLKINLDDNIKINNNMAEIYMLDKRTTLFKIIKNKLKKGFGV